MTCRASLPTQGLISQSLCSSEMPLQFVWSVPAEHRPPGLSNELRRNPGIPRKALKTRMAGPHPRVSYLACALGACSQKARVLPFQGCKRMTPVKPDVLLALRPRPALTAAPLAPGLCSTSQV